MFAQIEALDVTWVLLSSALVFLMQAGFCMLETGFVRAKNSINVAIKNLVDFCVASLVFWMFGFGLMFGCSAFGLIGTSDFLVESIDVPTFGAFFLFQVVFCGTATTIVSGAVAERMRFGSYVLLSLIVSGLIYPVYGHWAWGGIVGDGWLKSLGFIDFAGSTVVHSIGGWFALAAVLVLGPRIGRFDPDRPSIRGHNLPIATLGAFLLWFGWFGFNGGSSLMPDGVAVKAIINTTLCGSAAALASALIGWHVGGRPQVEPMINGVLAGLVGITAGCHLLSPAAAIVTGIVAGLLAFYGAIWLARWKIDDAVSAIPVHGIAGAWGTLATGLFLDPRLLPEGMTYWSQVGVQALGVGVGFAWAFGVGGAVCWTINRLLPLRVSAREELEGLNVSEHGASTELYDLLRDMAQHQVEGDFSRPVLVDPHTEVGQIAQEYNRVLLRVGQEIESRQEGLERVRDAEEKYRGIFENAVEGIFQTTPEGRYLSANPALARIYGYDSVEELMASVADIERQLYVEPGRRKEFVDTLAAHGRVTGFESQVRRKDGSVIWISESATAVKDAFGCVIRYEGTVEDIADRRVNEELRREKEHAELASAAKTEFLARMSHEIRTPLNGVIGMLELLASTPLSGQQRHYVEIGNSSATALLSVINDVLDLSKIEAGKLELESLEFDLQELVDDVTDMFAHRSEAKSVNLIGRIVEHTPSLVVGDPERLRQVLVNLVGNSLKFTERGQIKIEVAPESLLNDDHMLRFSVTDTGPGIPAERLGRLFQAFSQVDASIARTYGGTGLGLAICKQLIEAMGGRIGVDSRLNHGTTFWFVVPLPASERNPHNSAVATLAASRILVVDDVEANRLMLRDHLRRFGCEVSTAVDGESALALAREAAATNRPFHWAFVDQQLPRMAGTDVAEQLRQTPLGSNVKVALLASWNRTVDQSELQRLGIIASLTKPIRRSRLLNLLLQHMQPEIPGEKSIDRDDEARIEARSLPILVAEDHEVNQLVIEELLRSLGHRCEIAANGRMALEACKQREFSLVFADLQMPEMDGIEFTQAFRAWEREQRRDQRLPIVALTANAIASDRERCLAAGMDEFLAKPVHRADLVAMLQRFPIANDYRDAAYPRAGIRSPESPVDLQSLRARCGDNASLQARVLEKFSQRLEGHVREIEILALGTDMVRLRDAAHSLKGAAATVSAHDIAAAARDLEHVARRSEIEPINELVCQVQDAAQRFQAWFSRNGVSELSELTAAVK